MSNKTDSNSTLETKINAKTGRNMPLAILTAILLIGAVVASLAVHMSIFVLLVAIFITLALWEIHVDFALAGLYVPYVITVIASWSMIAVAYWSQHQIVALSATLFLAMIITSFVAMLHKEFSNRTLATSMRKILHQSHVAADPSQTEHAHSSVRHAWLHIQSAVFTLLYIPLMASLFVYGLTLPHAIVHALMFLFLPALADTGGLVFGASFGKHKLSPRISPKKSWEGLIGSFMFTLIGSVAMMSAIAPLQSSWWIAGILAFTVTISATFGDLCASMLKRDLGIKDMGHLLRGHGGVLDRLDSILISVPCILAIILIFGV